MKYFLRVHFNDGSIANVSAIGKEEKDLIAYDKYTTTKYYKNFLKEVTKRLNKKESDIRKVKIGYIKGNELKKDTEVIEYNLINNNPYMKDIFKYIEPKKVSMYGTNKYKSERIVISNTSPNYEEMKDYIFDTLKNDSKVLLDEVLKYKDSKDTFKDALDTYQGTYYDIDELADQEEKVKLERAIKNELTDYYRFRSMSVARFSYEEKKRMKEVYEQLGKKYDELDTIENKINEYKTTHPDSFIPETEEEYNMMADGPDGKVL